MKTNKEKIERAIKILDWLSLHGARTNTLMQAIEILKSVSFEEEAKS